MPRLAIQTALSNPQHYLQVSICLVHDVNAFDLQERCMTGKSEAREEGSIG